MVHNLSCHERANCTLRGAMSSAAVAMWRIFLVGWSLTGASCVVRQPGRLPFAPQGEFNDTVGVARVAPDDEGGEEEELMDPTPETTALPRPLPDLREMLATCGMMVKRTPST